MTSNKNNDHRDLMAPNEGKGNNVLDLGFNELVEEAKTREQIQRMADVHTLLPPELEERRVIYPGMRQQESLNAFRELRTKLYQLTGEQSNFSLMVCSVVAGGGSSFVAVNTSASIALDQSKTAVLVDCNLYQPGLHKLLPVEPDFGLADYLENVTLDIEDIIYSVGVRRLRLIPAGHQQQPGVEFFTSSRMKRFVERLKNRYRDRYIVLDSPPLSTFADARILSDLCDYVVLVVPYGRVSRAQLESAVDAISAEKLIGVVFNH